MIDSSIIFLGMSLVVNDSLVPESISQVRERAIQSKVKDNNKPSIMAHSSTVNELIKIGAAVMTSNFETKKSKPVANYRPSSNRASYSDYSYLLPLIISSSIS